MQNRVLKTFHFNELIITQLLQCHNNVLTFIADIPHENGYCLVAYDYHQNKIINKISEIHSAKLISNTEIFVKFVEDNLHYFAIYNSDNLSTHTEKFYLPSKHKNLEMLSSYWNGSELYFDYPNSHSFLHSTVIYNVQAKTFREKKFQYYTQMDFLDNDEMVHYCSEWSGVCWPSLGKINAQEKISYQPKDEKVICNSWSNAINDVFLVKSCKSLNPESQCLQFFSRKDGEYLGRINVNTYLQQFALLSDQKTLLGFNHSRIYPDKKLYTINLQSKEIQNLPVTKINSIIPMQDGSFYVSQSRNITRYSTNHFDEKNNAFLSLFVETELLKDLIEIIREYVYKDLSYTQFTPNHLAFFPKFVEEDEPSQEVEKSFFSICRIL